MMTLRMLANAAVVAVGLAAGGVVPAVAQSAMQLHVDGVVDGRLRQPSEARLILDFGSPALNATLGQAELVSTNPSVFPVPANLAGGQTAPVTINWPSAPAQVKVTARLRTAAGVVLGERSVEFTVLPYQAVRSIEMIPRKSRYTQGESATIRVTLMYTEPTDSFRLAMERPRVEDQSNQPYTYAGAVPWRPGGTTCTLSGDLGQAGCQYPINTGTQHLDFPITVWGDNRFVSVQRTDGVAARQCDSLPWDQAGRH